MNSIVINNQRFRYVDKLEELPLEQWQILTTFHHQKNNKPKELAAYAQTILPKLLGTRYKKINPQTSLQFLNHWSDTIAQQSAHALNIPWKTIRKHCKNTGIHWPKSSLSTDGVRLPLIELQAQPFCEATDLFLDDPIGEAHTIITLLCQPPSQSYEHIPIVQRAKNLKNAPMSIVLGLFNELIQTHQRLKNRFPACYRNPLHETTSQPQKISSNPPLWTDVLLWLADYRPSEIKSTEKLPCYEFMRLLNAKRQSLNPSTNPPLPCIDTHYST